MLLVNNTYIIKILTLIITGPCGIILNASIVAVHLSHWKNGVSFGECDQITLIKGITNVLLQCFLAFNGIINTFQLYKHFDKEFIFVSYTFFFFLTSLWVWLTAWLSICYCFKLCNISHRFFIILKKTVPRRITQLLLGTVMILGIIKIPIFWSLNINAKLNTSSTLTVPFFILETDIRYLSFAVAFVSLLQFGCCLPTLITSFCMGLSLMSLLRHVRRMKQNNSQSWSGKMKTHARACMAIFLLLALNLFFFLTVFISIILKFNIASYWDTFFFSIILASPSGQGFILLFGNSKLRHDLLKICL
ncbi:taste receptor type 2 member 7-like [Xenopus laevis]|uniref:Taste receptor type 2 n=1 Tax=Xenopus laevis TaxID=8355 RepID=A0A8J0TZM0_XENLA|nr:taste receptor type 2 member 7-like [Xenopus laevis]